MCLGTVDPMLLVNLWWQVISSIVICIHLLSWELELQYMYKTHHHSYDHWRRDIEQVGACRAHASFSGGAHSILCPSHRKTLCHGESNFTIEECEIKKPEKMDGKMHAPQNGYILYKYLYLCTVSRCWRAVHTKTGWFCLCVNIFLTPLHLMTLNEQCTRYSPSLPAKEAKSSNCFWYMGHRTH